MSEVWSVLVAAPAQGFSLPEALTPDKLWRTLAICVLAFVSIRAIDWSILHRSEKVARHNRLRIKQSQPFLRMLVMLAATFALVIIFIDENVWALTASVGLALGYTLKDYGSAFVAGIIGLFESPYRVGDRIDIAGHYGEVISYGLRGIRLRTPDDNAVTIPHSHLWSNPVSNANAGALEAQVVTEFYLAHEVDPEQVENILYRVAYTSKFTHLKLPIVVVMSEHSWGSLFKLRSYPLDARDEFAYKTDLTIRAKKEFAKRGLPYPKRFDTSGDA